MCFFKCGNYIFITRLVTNWLTIKLNQKAVTRSDSIGFKRFRRNDLLLIVCYMAIPPAWLVLLFRNRAKLNPTTGTLHWFRLSL